MLALKCVPVIFLHPIMDLRDFRSIFSFRNARDFLKSKWQEISAGSGDRFSRLRYPLLGFENSKCLVGEISPLRSALFRLWMSMTIAFTPARLPQIVIKLGEKREAELGAHTVRSHGVTLARTHMLDWLILVLLGVILAILNVIHPFNRFVGKDMMSDLMYPLKNNTIPVWAVPMYAVLLPVVVFLLFYLRRRDVYDLHHAVLGILFSSLITAVLTDVMKDAVGSPRPNFFWRCFPDGKDAYDQWGNVICHGDREFIREGYKSFPSGHTSWSFAGLSFLSLYLSGKLKVFDRQGHIAKLCLVVLPLLAASLVGVSQVDAYWHRWQDVFVGGLLGFVVATICYLQFFPPPYHVDGCRTYAYLQVMEDLRADTEIEIQPSDEGTSGVLVEDLESGRRL